MYKKRILSSVLLVLINSIAFGQNSLEQIQSAFLNSDSKVVLVAAHRAAHLDFPENSLPAIKEAIRIGVDIVELDVKVTKDGVPVLLHDGTINRTTTGSGKPSDYTLAELKKFRLIHAADTTENSIPTFEDALKLVKNKVMIDIDLKTDQLDPIIEVIRKQGCERQVFFFDNDYDALKYIRDVDSEFMLMPRAYSYGMADSALVRFAPEVIHIDFSFYNDKVTDLIKSNNARIWINALGEIDPALGTKKEDEAMDKLLKYGANIIQTDQPKLLLEALINRNLHP
jgi:glycerophosphoryl diester phosphodiesterase